MAARKHLGSTQVFVLIFKHTIGNFSQRLAPIRSYFKCSCTACEEVFAKVLASRNNAEDYPDTRQ